MKLLLIEDNPTMRSTLSRSFERRGMQVMTCDDGNAALGLWQQHQPDAVLQKRYRDSGSPALTAMMGGAGNERIKRVPKAGNDAVCLAWTLQGKCRTGCERKANHRQLSAAVSTALHKFLDECPGIKAPGP